MTRDHDLSCIHEPFGDAFYFGPERLSERYENDEKARVESGFSKSTYKTILDRIDEANSEVRPYTLPSIAIVATNFLCFCLYYVNYLYIVLYGCCIAIFSETPNFVCHSSIGYSTTFSSFETQFPLKMLQKYPCTNPLLFRLCSSPWISLTCFDQSGFHCLRDSPSNRVSASSSKISSTILYRRMDNLLRLLPLWPDSSVGLVQVAMPLKMSMNPKTPFLAHHILMVRMLRPAIRL